MIRPTKAGRILRSALASALALTATSVLGGGCLDRPVAPSAPKVSARVVERAKQNKITKIDLLFMIDNSSSMADKQALLAKAVPDLVNRLINPVCVDPKTFVKVGDPRPDGSCARGERDFEPVRDIHIGIISSSLGGHGADIIGSPKVCDDETDRQRMRSDPHNNDRGHLIARGTNGAAVTTFQGKGFLNWNPAPGSGGAATAADIVTPFATMVSGVGQHGCGYEASLESIYRFLVDPNPPEKIDVVPDPNSLGLASLVGTDTALLKQRADFLRPDSLVAIIAVTDENDCSIIDNGQNFYAILPPANNQSVLGHGTSACKDNPNDPCCYNCGQPTPAGCPDKTKDPECTAGRFTKAEDPENLRCYNQKQRYGIDFLYPVQRYIDGFSLAELPTATGTIKNPLFSDLQCVDGKGCAVARDKSLVFVAGIVGVPWQDIAVDPKDLGKGYKTAKQITDDNTWEKILGRPNTGTNAKPVPPTDKHMIESVDPRAGLMG
ncbi:MAG TPA: hypothetical protein VJT73_07890, partial [Polyangiaceae bacterium]|nr:hypothetical protein [Polyangiaceae bacterium]